MTATPPLWEGSSPLTRGKLGVRRANRVGGGLIPAHAGKTEVLGTPIDGVVAHPRSRGENELECIAGQVVGGSSPLTRGKRDACLRGREGLGLIPAHAGKT